MKKFKILYELSSTLTEKQLWPDGAPENPTIENVKNLIQDNGGIIRVIDDWNLDDGKWSNFDVIEEK